MTDVSIFLLQTAHIIHMRMESLRSMYTKIKKQAPSGSAFIGRTTRQKEIARLLWFIDAHVKTEESVTSYKGKSPGKAKSGRQYSYQRKVVRKATPKKVEKVNNSLLISLLIYFPV